MAPDQPLQVSIERPDGSRETVQVKHSYTAEQIEWFKAGSALNMIAAAQE